MSSYQVVSLPATIGVMAGLILVGSTFAELQGGDESMERKRPVTNSNWSNVAVYAEGLSVTTSGLSYKLVDVAADELLQEATAHFAAGFSGAMETLGSKYLEVVEDNFWDLVLR